MELQYDLNIIELVQ